MTKHAPNAHLLRRERVKGCYLLYYLSLKYDADGAAIVTFHLTDKEIKEKVLGPVHRQRFFVPSYPSWGMKLRT